MTDEELKALVAENSRTVAENSRAVAENSRAIHEMQEESERRREEFERRWQESREESERRWQESREESERQRQESREESERQWQENREESERQWQRFQEELVASRQETDRLVTTIHRDIGRLSNAFGLYTESMFQPSLKRILRERFGMTVITAPQKFWIDDDAYEIDIVGHAMDESDEVYLVEIKSQLREDGIEQMHEHLRRFARAFREHRGKKLFGILAAVTIPETLRVQALKQGLFLATVKDDVFELSTPDDFEPRPFGLRSLSPGS